MMTPEPRPGWWNSSRRPGPRGPKNWSKKSFSKGSSENGPGVAGGRRDLATCTVPMWTTAGRTRSATLTNADWRASAVLVTGPARTGTIWDWVNSTARIQKPAPTKAKIALTTTATRPVLGTIEIAGGAKEALVLQHLLRESPLWFHSLVPAHRPAR